MNHSSVFYQIIFYICKQKYFTWTITTRGDDFPKKKSIEENNLIDNNSTTDSMVNKDAKKEEDEEEPKSIKVKVSKLNKKSLLFESNDLTQSMVIPLKEIWDLKYEKNEYTFYLKSKPENLHSLKV